MSGGGHRASIFGLGALMYFVDARKNLDISSVASVSGGSLTNGFIAQSVDLHSVTPADFDRQVKPLARCIAQKGTVLPPSPFTFAYLVCLALMALASVIGVWLLPISFGWRVLLFFAGLLLTGWLAGLRGFVAARAFARRLFSPRGKPTLLSQGSTSVDHFICAADLHAGENVYFSPGFVCSYRYGWGSPGNLPLHVAVQCSAALPGAFPPRRLQTKDFRFQAPLPETQGTKSLVLVDGGVYDNQADQWVLGMANRSTRFGKLATFRGADELIAVNASGGLGWTRLPGRFRFPLVGEFMSLLRDNSILYDNGNALRRRLMIERFSGSAAHGAGLRGGLVHIPRSALHVARQCRQSPDPAMAARAEAVLALLEPDEPRWTSLAERASRQKTSLTKLGVAATADLLEHGYVLAMANLHVLLNYPLHELPARARFKALAT